mmetsp:Transcript_19600/g.45583  ORF Transcript_19600/g.45583 Transcript_19600/m.45583 type:complete len:92 (-) Transcript_19600:241-516(-)
MTCWAAEILLRKSWIWGTRSQYVTTEISRTSIPIEYNFAMPMFKFILVFSTHTLLTIMNNVVENGFNTKNAGGNSSGNSIVLLSMLKDEDD